MLSYNSNMAKEKKEEEKLFFGKLKAFIFHDTIWRILAIGLASAATVASGGATIPVVMLCATFAGSLLGVVGKLRQTRSLEKYRLQKTMAKAISEKHKQMNMLKAKNSNILNRLDHKNPTKEVHKIDTNEPSRTRSFLRTLRDVGLENSLSLVTLASASNLIGAVVYGASVALGIKNIKSEFNERVKTDFEKDETKRQINKLCEEAKISPYKHTKDLHAQFKEEMIDYESKKRLCELVGSNRNIGDGELKALYNDVRQEVQERIHFPDIPESVPFTKKFWDTVKPWNFDQIKKFDDIDVSKVSQYKEPHFKKKLAKDLHASKTPGLKHMRNSRNIV